MRRFELVEGTSNKFWEVDVAGNDVTTRWGRIGTVGQSKTKTFASPEAARKEHDDLVREKLAKGYREAGVEEPAPAEPESEEALPRGELARKAHPFRSLGLKRPDVHVDAAFDRMRAHYRKTAALWEEAAGRDAAMAPLLTRVKEKLSGSSPSLGLINEEVAIAAVLAFRRHSFDGYVDDDVIDRWVEFAGIPFAVRAAIAAQGLFATSAPLRLERTYVPKLEEGSAYHFVYGEIASLYRLRRHLASARKKDWTAAWEIARDARAAAPLSVRASIAYLFPEVTEWADEDARQVLEQGIDQPWVGALLMTSLDVGLATRLIDHIGQADTGIPCVTTGIHDVGTALQVILARGAPAGRAPGGPDMAGAAFSMIAVHGVRAVPALVKLFDMPSSRDEWRGDVAAALALLPSEEAFAALVSRLEMDAVRAAATDAAHRFPRLAIPVLASLAGQGKPLVKEILAGVLARNEALADEILPTLSGAARAAVEASRAQSAPAAAADDLPRVLSRPPWNEKERAAAESKPLQLAMLEAPVEVVWPAGMKEKWADGWVDHGYRSVDRDARILEWNNLPEGIAREASSLDDDALRARIASAAASHNQYMKVSPDAFVDVTERLALALWDTIPFELWSKYSAPPRRFVAKFEARALPTLLRYVAANPRFLELLIPFRAPAAASLVADALARLKTVRHVAGRWLLLHAGTAAIALVPQAVGPRGAAREAAANALRFLAANGHEKLVMSTAARYGAEAAAAVRKVLDFDPLLLYPSKLPQLPSFWQRGVFTRPLLRRTGAALSADAMDALATMLAFSSLEEPYAGLADVKDACEPSSLAAFAWDVFSAWLAEGAPSKEAWALNALGHLGDDACARRLAPLLREWPGEGAHARAVMGLDVLAAIGSDVALMHLHGIAQKAKFKGLQERAREKIEAIAERRGLTAEELADRLVPDLGLEDDGSMTLDFGPRSFRVGFDEHLRPYVKDAQGKKLPDLPKPGKGDDAEKGRQATERWKALKKDAKTLASQQMLRLELAMCSRRRFEAGIFRQFFVEHPVVQHLVRRIVWGAYNDKGRLLSTFRVSEDRTFADAKDEAYPLPEGARVGVVHPYELTGAVAAAWGQLFGDYEILQPWRQLGREVYRPTAGEREAKTLTRWTEVTVPVGKVLGLEQRGWRRGPAGDGGIATWYVKPLPPEHEIRLELDPGIDAGGVLQSGEQTLGEVRIVECDAGWRSEGVVPFGELDPILFSELVRDLEALRS